MTSIRHWVTVSLLSGLTALAVGCAVDSTASEESATTTMEQELSPSQLSAACARMCLAGAAMPGCQSFEGCYAECTYVDPVRPECMNPYHAMIECAGSAGPSGLTCYNGITYVAAETCGAAIDAVYQCQGGPNPNGSYGLCRAQCNRIAQLDCAPPKEACYDECTMFADLQEDFCASEYQQWLRCQSTGNPENWTCQLMPVDFDPETGEFIEANVPTPDYAACYGEERAYIDCLLGYH